MRDMLRIEQVKELIEYYNSKNIYNDKELNQVMVAFNRNDEIGMTSLSIKKLRRATKNYSIYLEGIVVGYNGAKENEY